MDRWISLALCGGLAAAAYYAVTAILILWAGLGMDPAAAWFVRNVWLQPGVTVAKVSGVPLWSGIVMNMSLVAVLFVAVMILRRRS